MLKHTLLLASLALAGLHAGAETLEADLPIEQTRPAETVDEQYDARYWILRGLQNNFDLQINRLETENADDRVEIALGVFTPRATARGQFARSQRSQNQREFNATGNVARIFDEEIASMRIGLEGRMQTGTRLEVTTGTSRIRNTSNSVATAPFRPEFQSVSQVSVVQPLLLGRGREVNMAAVNLARSEVLGAEFDLRSTVEQVIAQILIAYVEMEFAHANLAVKEEAVGLAENLIGENRRRLEEGMMSPIDVTQAEARRAEAMEELVEARTFLRQRMNRLKELTGTSFDFEETVQIGGSVAGLLAIPSTDRNAMGRQMLTRNSIYQSALNRVEAENIRIAFARNQLLPQLDLEASLGYNGLEGSFGSSYSNYGQNKDPDWSVGFVFSMPISRDAERAQLRETQRVQRQALLLAKQTEVQLLALLDNSMRDVESARERIGFVQDSVRLAEEGLRSEERRLASGLTTSYNVANQQRDLSFARTRGLAAEVELFRALTQLYIVAGTLSSELQMDVVVAER